MLELWGAEYQESNALLLRPSDRCFLERVCQREKCPVDFVGNITGDGKARFSLDRVDKYTSTVLISPHSLKYLTNIDSRSASLCLFSNTMIYLFPQIVLVDDEGGSSDQADRGRCPVDLQLEWVLGKMPQKVFKMEHLALSLQPLALPARLKVKDALDRVLRLPAVASKRYLTNKVCVTSLPHSVFAYTCVQTLCDSTGLHSLPSPRWTGL